MPFLVVETSDIQIVFDLYEQLGCLSKVKRSVDTLWPERNWSRGRIHNILINPIYIGKIKHKTEVYEGLHEAIIEQDQFDRVQAQLQAKSVIKRGKHPSRGPSAYLVGKVYDETGDRLTPSKSKKSSGRVIRYYYSNRLISGGADPTGWRLRAVMLEQLLSEIVGTRLSEALTQFRLAPELKPHELNDATDRLAAVDTQANFGSDHTRADLSETTASIQLDVEKVADACSNSVRTESSTWNACVLRSPLSSGSARMGPSSRGLDTRENPIMRSSEPS